MESASHAKTGSLHTHEFGWVWVIEDGGHGKVKTCSVAGNKLCVWDYCWVLMSRSRWWNWNPGPRLIQPENKMHWCNTHTLLHLTYCMTGAAKGIAGHGRCGWIIVDVIHVFDNVSPQHESDRGKWLQRGMIAGISSMAQSLTICGQSTGLSLAE